MNVRRWLMRYRELMEEVDRETKQAHYWEDKATGLSAPQLSFAPVHGGKTMPDYIVEFLEVAKHCSELAGKADKAKDEILEVIESIEKPAYRNVLKYRYIDNMKYIDIAKKMDYSPGYIRRLTSKAVKEVTKCNKYLTYNGSVEKKQG